tara:strand:+ start:3040 stop:3819 length:780 start_codon:yes stop_codon:yes gene_type:complete
MLALSVVPVFAFRPAVPGQYALTVSNQPAVAAYTRFGVVMQEGATDTDTADAASSRSTEKWDETLAQLVQYRAEWGNADAPLGTGLGKWCAQQRRSRELGRLSLAQTAELDALGFSWVSPSDVDDPVTHHDWDAMVERLAAYVQVHGDGDVPKKHKLDPALGGWVAALRRCRSKLDEQQGAQLEAAGFQWASSRQCGSAFMKSFRELRSFWEDEGHTRVGEVLGDEHELAQWCETVRASRRSDKLSPKRLAYLEDIGFS